MGYIQAFKAAGAKVLASDCFGDYSGEGIVYVEVNGVRGYIIYGYGSCDYCDLFQSYGSKNRSWGEPLTAEQLAEFGKEYVEGMITYEKARESVLGGWGNVEEQIAFLKKCEGIKD
jgi:hypothetical protein